MTDRTLTFAEFRLDPASGHLYRGSEAVPLAPKAFALLQLLAGQSGRLIAKQELLTAVWPGVFVGDAVLKSTIREVRKALGDDSHEPRFIETAHRRGYRFIAALEPATRLAIVTRARRPETDLALRLSGLDGSFATVVTSEDVLDQPPAPALHAQAVELLSRRRTVQPARAIAMASATLVVRGARAAGLPVLAVAAPAHVALEADAAVDGLEGLTLDAMTRLLRLHPSAAQP